MFERISHPERLGVHIANASPNERARQAIRDAIFFLAGMVATLFILSWMR